LSEVEAILRPAERHGQIGVEHRAYAEGCPQETAPGLDVSLAYAAKSKAKHSADIPTAHGVSFQLAAQSYVYDNFYFSANQFLGGGGGLAFERECRIQSGQFFSA
jgi:hypothetical protein